TRRPRSSSLFPYTTLFRSLAVIERAGHELMLEAPERFRAVIEPFLERGLPPAPASPATPLAKHGDESCQRERNRVFEGEYDSLRSEEHTSELQSRSDLVCR